MAKRWRQHPGARSGRTGSTWRLDDPSSTRRHGRGPVRSGKGPRARTAAKGVARQDRERKGSYSRLPGQDGRKITEKGWANNDPPLEVP
ncbi:hypothetical protein DESPIG_00459 [Desulfovibrio piger ATCC 29098]|uniref:Uncharacterized protein n=1 Tax=Desulfovibrio piger ATCC 29098 TaxID=411464 RepID=B6WQX9_9BACT|nr:hypothetical protein DESPIG_00459 [Desulfovibrio piger ATCC 29098]